MKKNSRPEILIVAGEVSGDQLAGSILQRFQDRKKYHFFGCGGSIMQRLNVEILFHIKQLEVIGISEAIFKYALLKRYLKSLIYEAINRKVRHAFLVDYPGFNLALAKELKKNNIQSHLIVSPQVWAWKPKRIYKIKEYITSVLCLYDFEMSLYKKNNVKAFWIGHPIANKVCNYQENKRIESPLSTKRQKKIIVSLLPGSRRKEIERLLPFMIRLAQKIKQEIPNTNFLLPCPQDKFLISLIRRLLHKDRGKSIKLMSGKIYDALSVSQMAVVCSGTASLECVLFGVPLLLLYKTSWLSYLIARLFLVIPYIGLANVISSRFVHREFIQQDIKLNPICKEACRLITDQVYRKKMLGDFSKIKNKITKKDASLEGCKIMEKILRNKFKFYEYKSVSE